MSERLVEYLVVAGAGKADPRPTTPPDQSGVVSVVEIEACVHQRLPLDNKPGFPLPYGIERFCRPQGWFLTSHASPPSFTNLVLTSETGSRLYCTSLNFHQPSSKMAARQRQRLQQQQQIDKEKEKEIEQEQDELDMPPIRRGSFILMKGHSRSP